VNPSLFCPACEGVLAREGAGFSCKACGKAFTSEAGIPLFFLPNDWDGRADVTEAMKAFYEETPFPNYEDIDSVATLRDKAEKGVLARLLDEQLPNGARVIECGCGTGQLSNFLGITGGRQVIGADMCLNSLRLAQAFKTRNEIENVSFCQMNLFRPVFARESFDLVISNGVLHHTADPYLAFRSILRLAKPGGHVLIGLYHAYSRIPTDVRRAIFNATGNRFQFLDPRIKREKLSETRKRTWFMDQYKNPHESKHTFGEVLRWFEESGVDFVSSIPKTRPFESVTDDERLFEPSVPGTGFERLLVETGMLLTADREGGFFVMIGRKRTGAGV